MHVGHYKVDGSMPSGDWPLFGFTSANNVTCVTILWPNHTWMHSHGWGQSQPDCVAAFEAHRRDVCTGAYDNQIGVFDSMFTQAQLMGRANISRAFEMLIAPDVGLGEDRFQYGQARSNNITHGTVAIVVDNAAASLSSLVELPHPGKHGTRYPQMLAEYVGLSGRLGRTLKADKVGLRPQPGPWDNPSDSNQTGTAEWTTERNKGGAGLISFACGAANGNGRFPCCICAAQAGLLQHSLPEEAAAVVQHPGCGRARFQLVEPRTPATRSRNFRLE